MKFCFSLVVISCFIMTTDCRAQTLSESIEIYNTEVAAAREIVVQEWQKLLTESLASNDQTLAGQYRDWSEMFKTEGALFIPEKKASMGNVFKAYGTSLKSSSEKLRLAYLSEIDAQTTAGNTEEVESLLEELSERRLPGKLVSLQPHRSNNYLNHWAFVFRSSSVKPGSEKMNATMEMAAGLSNPRFVSMRASNFPHMYLTAVSETPQNIRIRLTTENEDPVWKLQATMLQVEGLVNPKNGVSFQSLQYPDRYLRIRANGEAWLDRFEENAAFRNEATFNIKPPVFPLWPNK